MTGVKKIYPKAVRIKKDADSQKVLDALDDYLENNVDEPMKWLVRFWKDQAAVMLYRDLREIVTGETDPESLFEVWFQDYSKMLADKMAPVWTDSFRQGWKNTASFHGVNIVSSEAQVRSWIMERTGNLITNCCQEQIKAVRYLIAESETLHMSSAETARYIRPTIGLTERQAEANLKHYNAVKEKLRAEHPRMKPETIEQRARTSAAKYAEKQQRYRAETIARTEIAQAYNEGTDAFIRDAMERDEMPEMKKVWSTAKNSENVCEACKALEGKIIGMDEDFEAKSGRKTITKSVPPLHPRCKCAVKYVEVRDEDI